MTNRLRRHTISFLPQTGPSYSKRPLIVFYERIKVREHTIEEGKFLKEKLICFTEYTNNCLNNISEIIPMHIVCNIYSRLKFEKKCNFGKLHCLPQWFKNQPILKKNFDLRRDSTCEVKKLKKKL